MIFNMEEDAYRLLKDYLDEIKNVLRHEPDAEEIMRDIEARIAEILNDRSDKRLKAVSTEDVNFVMLNMGKPGDFGDAPTDSAGEPETTTSQRKRLFRDPDQRILGGVCAGLGHYFGLDPVMIRLLLVGIVLLGGSGILLYIILWIVMPKAETAADRLSMKGEPVNLETIKNMFRPGSKGEAKAKSNLESVIQKIGAFFLEIIRLFAKTFGKLLGFALLAFTVVGFFAISALYFSIQGGELDLHLNDGAITAIGTEDLSGWLFGDADSLSYFSHFAVFLAGLPLLILMLVGLKLIFKSPAIKASLLSMLAGIWFLAVLAAMAYSFYKAGELRAEEYQIQRTTLQWPVDTLYLAAESGIIPDISPYQQRNNIFIDADETEASINAVSIKIAPSPGDSLRIEIQKTARGTNSNEALLRAGNIEYNFRIEGNRLMLMPVLRIFKEDMYRFQSVKVNILLPQGTTVYLDPSIGYMLEGAPTHQKIKTRDMQGHYWQMTQGKLVSGDF
jgi:phage shock protein PspC (stress-responsive transcriptional regulator)